MLKPKALKGKRRPFDPPLQTSAISFLTTPTFNLARALLKGKNQPFFSRGKLGPVIKNPPLRYNFEAAYDLFLPP